MTNKRQHGGCGEPYDLEVRQHTGGAECMRVGCG
jgi:hypothetical protein